MRSGRYSWLVSLMFVFLVTACGRGGSNTPTDTTAPTTPTDVKAVAMSPTEIMLSWGAASDEAGVAQYEIYVGDYSVASMESTTTIFLYTGLIPSTEYCCTVRAIDAAGNESAPSDPPACAVTGSTADTTPPAVPTGLSGAASQSKIALSWTASAEASSYKVYRDSVFIGTAPITTFLDDGLNASSPYCYTVAAVDAAGNESAKSSPACITTLAPPLDTSIPTVISTFPARDALDVQIDPFVATATFSEAMNMLSVTTADRFTITNTTTGLVSIASVTYDAGTDTVKITPLKPLAPGEVYTATISRNVQDVAGNSMGVDYIWSFTTTTAPAVTLPTVTSTTPANGTLNVDVNIQQIQAVFSEALDPTTIMPPTSNFSCFDTTQVPNNSVPGSVSYDPASDPPTAVFTLLTTPPTPALAKGTIYECRILKNVTDISGHGMAATYTWHFVTAP